jgi:HEAT repeat protein
VAPEDVLYFVGYLLRFARRLKGEERESLKALAAPFLSRIAEKTSRGSDEARARAVRTLGSLGLPEHGEAVKKGLRDPSPLVAMIAAESLARADHPESAEDILQHLPRFQEWAPAYLAELMAGVGVGAGPLLQALLEDPAGPPWVRAVCADALASLAFAPAAAVAAEVAAVEDEPVLLVSCLRLLSRVGHTEHRPAVERLLTFGDVGVRSQAVATLAHVGTREDAVLMEGALADPSPWVALEGARGLRDLAGPEALIPHAETGRPWALVAGQVLAE